MKNQKVFIGVICAFVCELFYGFSYLFTKQITNSVSPMTLLSWRFMVAFLLLNLCVLTRIIKVDFKRKPILTVFWVAIFHPVFYFIGETYGIRLTSASESGTIIACLPIVTLLFSALILKEKPSKLQVVGISITVSGVILIVLLKGLEATFNPIGYLMLMFAVVSYSLYSVFAQKAVEFTSAEKTYAMLACGAITFTLIAFFQNAKAGTLKEFALLPFTNFEFLIAILYLSIGCCILAFLLSNIAIASIGTNRAASFVGISTIVSVIAGIIILKEPFSIYQIIGTAMVIAGVYAANKVPRDRKLEPEHEAEQLVQHG